MPDTGADLGADLYELYVAGKRNLPDVAVEYADAARYVSATGDMRPDGHGYAPIKWRSLCTEIEQMLGDTGKNLDDTALALCTAVTEYGAADTGAKVELERLISVNGVPE